jgi:hypothetical protein
MVAKYTLQQKLYIIRGSVGNPTAVLRFNTANSSMTIGVKLENMNKRIGSVQA